MARKKHKKVAIKQDSIKKPADCDYHVNVIPFKDSRGNNKLDLESPGGKPLKELHVYASEGSGKRLVVCWQVDTSQVPGETAALIQITFPIGTPFSYIIGPIEIDDPSGTAVNMIWKRIKRKGNVITGVKFYYSVALFTQDGSGGTQTYVAELADPMVIVDAGGG
jgi:hypothetical protein